MRRLVLVPGLAAAAAMIIASSVAATQPGPPGDREIRVSRDGRTIVTTLTLMLAGPAGPLPMNLRLIGRRDSTRPEAPAEYAMEFHLGFYSGLRSSERPHYQLMVRSGAGDRTLAEGSVDGRLVIEEVSLVQAPLDIVGLSQLARANAAFGRLFGVVFVLTREQIQAVGEFAERVMKG
jgi:hypothetical protein